MNEVVEALAPNILVQFLSLLHRVIVIQVITIPFPPVYDLCSFSQIFADMAGTFES